MSAAKYQHQGMIIMVVISLKERIILPSTMKMRIIATAIKQLQENRIVLMITLIILQRWIMIMMMIVKIMIAMKMMNKRWHIMKCHYHP